MPLKLEYYYGSEAEQYSFYRIPKPLFDDPYKSLSVEAKVLYGLLLDRMGLSIANHWVDRNNRVFIYFTLDETMKMLNIRKDKAMRLFKDLEDIGLIVRRRQGQGKPVCIYVKNFIIKDDKGALSSESQPELPPELEPLTSEKSESEPETSDQTSEKPQSKGRKNRSLDFGKTEPNKTEKNKTECIYTESIYPLSSPTPEKQCRFTRQTAQDRIDQMDECREQIKDNIDYDLLIQEYPFSTDQIDGYVELMLEVFCSDRPSFRICGDNVPTSVVQGRFLKLTHEHITYVMDCMAKNTTLIGNIKAYTLAALYNAPVTIGQYYAALVNHDMAQPDF